MEPRDRAAPAVSSAVPVDGATTPASRLTLRLVAACVLLTGLAFVQSPGLLVSDTKFDLVADPGGFLSRALHLWDAEGTFGQLQNQAYGYLWPMGPFFWLGDTIGLDGWVVQRLWWAVVLCTALVGTALLLRALGVRSDIAVLVGAAAYALSPRLLTVLGPISIEGWPSALAPWVLLALVVGSERGSPRRAAALAALGVAMVGGVNAAATFAVIPLGALWLLTRAPGPRRRALMIWWPLFTLLGTLWWLVPLFLMGAYSPPFLDFIETSGATTFPTTVFDALRGTSNWVPYLDARSRAGNDLVTTSYLVLNSGVVLLVGAAGLLDRRTPHRTFLAGGLALGLVMVTAGHAGAVSGWFAGDLAQALDGALAPLRNVHKFDPLVRLPLVVGLGFLLDHAVRRTPRSAGSGRVVERGAVLATTMVVVVGAAMPALLGRLAPTGESFGVPDHWPEAAAWLADQDDGSGRDGGAVALLAPGSRFADYDWGSPRDEPLQFLAGSRWAVRNVIPLTPPGTIRMLDGIEQRLAQGEGGAGLTAYLQRAGVRHVVVRNDLLPDGDQPPTALVHQALESSPGLEVVATFGPDRGGETVLEADDGDRLVLERGWREFHPAIEVFEVPGAATTLTSTWPDVVAGGPEDLADLLDLGVVADRPTVLAADAPRGPDGELGEALAGSRVVLTDGLRARERDFARINDASSPVLTGDEPRTTTSPTRDYLLDTEDRWSTTAAITGAARVSASSSVSDAGGFGAARRGALPFAAVDGDPGSSWTADAGTAGRAWWQVDLEEPLPAERAVEVRLTGGADAVAEQVVRLRWPGGTSEEIALPAGDSVDVRVQADGPVGWLRVEDASPAGEQDVSLAEVVVPGTVVERWYELPELPASWGAPDQVVLRADRDARDGCAEVGSAVRCTAEAVVADEEPGAVRRVVTVPTTDAYMPRLTVRPRAGDVLGSLTREDGTVRVSASSLAVPDPRASATAAVDGLRGTTWLADPDDLRPELDLTFLGPRVVTEVEVRLDAGAAARAPTELALTWPGGRTTVELRDGRASFPPITAERLTVAVVRAESDVSAPGAGDDGPSIGISELRLEGAPDLPVALPTASRALGCGTGPTLVVGGVRTPTEVVTSGADAAGARTAEAVPCGEEARVVLAAGRNEVVVEDGAAFAVDGVVLTRVGARTASTSPVASAGGIGADASTRALDVGDGDRLAVVRENVNPGWAATQDGAALDPLVVDGWQQGWALPGVGTGEVVVRYVPDATYRAGMAVGGLALLVLVGVVVLGSLPARRRRAGRDARASAGPLRPRGHRPWPAVALVLLVLGVVAGTGAVVIGAAVGVVLAAAATVLRERADDLVPWVLALPLFAAAVGYALQPWGSASGWAGASAWPQHAALVTLAGVLLRAALEPGAPPDDDPAGAAST
ncbi:alpha-(1-_3)-arabinofuranosyltransferase domain-containing protein [Nocardioides sp. CPCC 205120]|uniref:alpha-(1->3)-arabinofuranosyltransferase domain-containing protein n=1 Tax=Nocardioides sp. CPCC 205120 TaxID=3406462 RepID=UPI003B503CEE